MRVGIWRAALAAVACLSFGLAADAADEKKPTEKKPPSECRGLDNNACTAKSQCTWRKEITMKNGKTRKAHCRKKSTPSTAAKKST